MENRSDVASNNNTTSTSNYQHNVHLYMHHVCACQNIYPPPYYPPLGYRAPMISFAPPQSIPRPYLQHYQYTQFNVNSQIGLPLTPLTQLSSFTQNQPPQTEAATVRSDDRTEPESDQDFSPVSDLFLNDSSEMNTENFIKFVERSLLNAEQIAYRNRNRPCFRNIQNLCIRTRSEILKPRTTVSNIHSQGIPWATKDFIYAFVRLTNCWHILKGYWENREGSALGKIEKELTPNFRSCYLRWERETAELATELSRIFNNLDTNQSNPISTTTTPTAATAAAGASSDLVSAQMSLLRALEKSTSAPALNTPASTSPSSSKNLVRGILRLPSPETADQANQTSEFDEDDVNYMKPGSYHVPKKNQEPREIEFLDTAQNVSKNLETVQDKYWVNQHTDLYNVQEWISASNFSQNSSRSNSPPKGNGWSEYLSEKNYEQIKNIFEPSSAKWADFFEGPLGGLTSKTKAVFEKVLAEMKQTEMIGILADGFMDCPSLELIERNIAKDNYSYVNEIVRDLRHVVNRANLHFTKCGYTEEQVKIFPSTLENLLVEHLPHCDFDSITGERDEIVGKLTMKNILPDEVDDLPI